MLRRKRKGGPSGGRRTRKARRRGCGGQRLPDAGEQCDGRRQQPAPRGRLTGAVARR